MFGQHPLLVFFLLRAPVAAAVCSTLDESCAADLGLLQKSIQAQVPVEVTRVNSLPASELERKKKDDEEEEMEIKDLHKVNSSSLSALYDSPLECKEGEVRRKVRRGEICETCRGMVRRRRADTCDSCLDGYVPEDDSDSCKFQPYSGSTLVDYTRFYAGKASGIPLNDGKLTTESLADCATACRENAACLCLSYNKVSGCCYLYSLMQCGEESTPTANYETFVMTVHFSYYHPGGCVMSPNGYDIMTIDKTAIHAGMCWFHAFLVNVDFFAFNFDKRECRFYWMSSKKCREDTSLSGFQTYSMDLKNIRQPNDASVKLKSGRVLAVTFQGHGKFAMSCYAGMMAGLLAGAMKANGGEEFTLKKLMRKFDIVVSNSGGTWYAGSLMYSDFFRETQEAMGRNPTQAGEIWNDRIMNAKNNMRFITDVANGSFYQTIKGVKEGLTGTDWDIELANVSAHQAWAKDKLWIIAASLTVGNPKHTVRVNQQVRYYMDSTNSSIQLPRKGYIPSFFSIRLNKLASSYLSPVPFCGKSGGEFCFNVTMVHPNRPCSKYMEVFPNTVFGVPGRMLLTSVFAASGAAFASTTMGASAASTNGRVASQMSIWAMPWTLRPLVSGDIVLDGSSYPDESLCEIFALSDGGFTDNSGITHAVANGADEVTSFLHSNGILEELSAMGSPHEQCPYSLFAEDLKAMMMFTEYKKDAYSVQMQFSRVRFVIMNVTTRKNQWFGTSAGKEVRLNLMIMYTLYSYQWQTLHATAFTPGFGIVVQRLVNTLVSPVNKWAVCASTLRFFHVNIGCVEPPGKDASIMEQIEYYKHLSLDYTMVPSEYFWNKVWSTINPIVSVSLRMLDYMYVWVQGGTVKQLTRAKAGCDDSESD